MCVCSLTGLAVYARSSVVFPPILIIFPDNKIPKGCPGDVLRTSSGCHRDVSGNVLGRLGRIFLLSGYCVRCSDECTCLIYSDFAITASSSARGRGTFVVVFAVRTVVCFSFLFFTRVNESPAIYDYTREIRVVSA